MRPPSILVFERLFFVSLALSVASFVIGYDAATKLLESEPAMQQLGLGGGFLIGSMAVSLAVYLLLWFFIARKASNLAKWILTAFTGVGVLSFLASAARTGLTWDINTLLGVAYYGFAVAAIVFLFKDDAKAWLKGERKDAPATPD